MFSMLFFCFLNLRISLLVKHASFNIQVTAANGSIDKKLVSSVSCKLAEETVLRKVWRGNKPREFSFIKDLCWNNC